MLMCHALHTYVHCSMADKKKLAELLRPEDVCIPVLSAFVGGEYLQHGDGAGVALKIYVTAHDRSLQATLRSVP